MLCEKCHTHEAIMHLTHFADGRGGTLHLCLECARKLGLDALNPPEGVAAMERLIEHLSRLGEMKKSLAAKPSAPEEEPETETCPRCGAPLGRVRESGTAGCPDCLFWLLRASGRPIHPYFGKHPAGLPPEDLARLREIRLRARLERAVAEERYEDAAKLRDLLRASPAAAASAPSAG